MDLSRSTARPLTPLMWPPTCLSARSRTAEGDTTGQRHFHRQVGLSHARCAARMSRLLVLLLRDICVRAGLQPLQWDAWGRGQTHRS